MKISTAYHLKLFIRQQRHNIRLVLLVLAGFWVLSIAHIIIGSSPAIAFLAALTMSISLAPMFIFGSYDLGSWLVAMTAARYVGFPMLAKLWHGQALDSNLSQPLDSFAIVLFGVISYTLALFLTHLIKFRKPLLSIFHLGKEKWQILRLLAFGIGVAANLFTVLRAGGTIDADLSVGNFFRNMLHLALIVSIFLCLKNSDRKKSLDAWVVLILLTQIFFALSSNQRDGLINAFVAYIGTLFAFGGRISRRMIFSGLLAVVILLEFITPWFLYVRSARNELDWTERIEYSVEAIANWKYVEQAYQQRVEITSTRTHLNYYGSYQNTLERVSFINHIDVIRNVTGPSGGSLGWEDIGIAIKSSLPTFLAPDKPRGYGHGDWVYCQTGVFCYLGSYNTLQLLPNAYASFGWTGTILYPLIFGFLLLLSIKLTSGLNLAQNIWGIYMLVRIHNSFAEGGTSDYIFALIRAIPQDILLISLLIGATHLISQIMAISSPKERYAK